MPVEHSDMVLGDAMMQMCDGIHGTSVFMHVSGNTVKNEHISAIRNRMQERLVTISREIFLDMLEDIGASFNDMEKVYGEYNSFAKSPDREEYFAWYNHDR